MVAVRGRAFRSGGWWVNLNQAIIEIAGIDGSGKSTLTTRLTEGVGDSPLQLGYSEPPKHAWFASASADLEQRGTCDVPLEVMFRAALTARLHTTERLRASGGVAVLDRHVLSLAAFYEFMGVGTNPIVREEFPQALPDRVVLLDEPPELCMRRLLERGRPLASHERSVSQLTAYRGTLLQASILLGVPTLVVTSSFDLQRIRRWCVSGSTEPHIGD